MRLDPLFPRELLDLKPELSSVWVAGEVPPPPRVAIVGARAADAYGTGVAARIAGALAAHGVAVVSGGARGVDAAAHRAALAAGGTTVAVLGTGIDIAYPPEHAGLFARIAAPGGGALVCQYPPGTAARPGQFPARNRLLAALSDAVVVVQAGPGSGALITADEARALRRPVLAVPGAAGAPLSTGTHGLLRGRQAAWCEDASDVLRVLADRSRGAPPRIPAASEVVMAQDELPGVAGLPVVQGAERVWRALSRVPLPVDDIAESAGLEPGVARSALVWLELQGLCRYEYGVGFARN
ncbi:MAG TPA: DNA-processing protein DprA [Myxococcota bacterium]|jgi:DNA processing protein|nr:DNA-processing protein DprA [Myxococcota bacterium]